MRNILFVLLTVLFFYACDSQLNNTNEEELRVEEGDIDNKPQIDFTSIKQYQEYAKEMLPIVQSRNELMYNALLNPNVGRKGMSEVTTKVQASFVKMYQYIVDLDKRIDYQEIEKDEGNVLGAVIHDLLERVSSAKGVMGRRLDFNVLLYPTAYNQLTRAEIVSNKDNLLFDLNYKTTLTEASVLSELFKYYRLKIVHDKFDIWHQPDQNIVRKGSTYKARFGLGAYSTQVKYKTYIDGELQKQRNNLVLFEKEATEIGKQTIEVKVQVINPLTGESEDMVKDFIYEVIE